MSTRFIVGPTAASLLQFPIHVCPDEIIAKKVKEWLERGLSTFADILEISSNEQISAEPSCFSLDFGGNLIGSVEPFMYEWQENGRISRFFFYPQHLWDVVAEFNQELRMIQTQDREFSMLMGARNILCLSPNLVIAIRNQIRIEWESLKARHDKAVGDFETFVTQVRTDPNSTVHLPEEAKPNPFSN